MIVDSHCHLDFNDFEGDITSIIEHAKDAGVSAILNAGNNLNELKNQLELSEKYPFIYTAVGVHPHNAAEYPELTAADLLAHTTHKKVVGIGETGLDYYYDFASPDLQIKLFKEHIAAAQESSLPIIVHTRDADADTMELLEKAYKAKPFSGEIHCFSGSKELAEFALSLGFYLSASGIITFNKSADLREIFAAVPTDKLLVETDSPYLAPVPMRGKRNEPAFVHYTLEKLASIKGVDEEKLKEITSCNFYKLFRKASDKGRYKYLCSK